MQQHTDVSVYSTRFISNLIENRMSDLNLASVADYQSYLTKNTSEFELFDSQLKNSYSLFFRNRLTFETLHHIVLPRLAAQKADGNELRVWSAGCAGGQEPYSLAILFESFHKISSTKLNYRIFATDRDYSEIERAVVGEFSRLEIANLTNVEMDSWFAGDGKKFKIDSRLKKHIEFELFDLLDNECLCPRTSIYGAFDIIMCANVLIYYNESIQQFIISNLQKCISENGIIITGEAERELFIRYGYTEIYPQSCIFKF